MGSRAEIAATRTTYELGGPYRELDAKGTAYAVDGTITLSLVRRRRRNFYLSCNASYRNQRDAIGAVNSSTVKTIVVGSAASRYDEWLTLFGRNVYVRVEAAVVDGYLSLADPEQEAFNRAGADTAGGYLYMRLGGSSQLELSPRLGLTVAASGQKSLTRNLDASEQMMVTGPHGVRAYRTVMSGDNGYLVSAELRYALRVPSILGAKVTHSLGLFGDLGGVHLQHDAYSDFKGARLQDVGVGYLLRYGGVFGSVQVARALGYRPESTQAESPNRVLLQVGMSL
jgi:hemolysin activation/secretion protein